MSSESESFDTRWISGSSAAQTSLWLVGSDFNGVRKTFVVQLVNRLCRDAVGD